MTLDLRGRPSAGEVLARIRNESRDQSEKGRWFEQLFMRIALQEPEFEVAEIWRWPDWPEREALTGLDGRDIGIDLVAKRTSGEWIAIQCKCYDERHVLAKAEIDKFLGGSQQAIFRLRWAVATCRWGPNAQRAILNAQPPITQIDFNQSLAVQVEEETAERPIQQPWRLQEDAIEDTVAGLGIHDRGRLVLACGTGKTFTSLRIAQNIVDDGGRILFAAPTIALVSQARREWLRQTTRRIECIVVCSDSTAGGRNENEDIGISELECPVTTNPAEIAQALTGEGPTRVVFCTYHSLGRVTEAQDQHAAPAFDLAIADEAHRTTGALIEGRATRGREVNFQEFHDDVRLRAHKRLYMTATPRLYTERSKGKLAAKGITVVDMGDYDVYGPELHRLPFKKAVDAKMLSDYRVIVLGVNQSSVTPGLRRRLEGIETEQSPKKRPNTNDMTRVLGVSLAVNGVTEGKTLEQPGKLQRTLAFANSIARSKWYTEALMESEVLRATTRRMKNGRAMSVIAKHLDASATALVRNRELRALANAGQKGECRILSNVKLFTEGVDVPQLDAVAFIDPRDSQVDVVQAVGRVMRKAPGKRFGYIIIPVVVEPGQDVAEALMKGTEGYQTVGRVLRALQAHDGRLAESPATFVKVYEEKSSRAPGDERQGGAVEAEGEDIQRELELKEAEQGIYAHVAAASGLGKPGQLVADEIADSVKAASAVLQDEQLEDPLAEALDLTTEADGGAKGICTIAALLLCNACLLQRRLRDEPGMQLIIRLDKIAGAKDPRELLEIAWEMILEKDYAPVFKPALAALGALPDNPRVANAIRTVAECANRVADSLSELGYDHAGPLYHRILGSAKSDGAFYTNNLSAIMLAGLALTDDFVDWSDPEAVGNLRIMDPACGTGTLLMATLQTIKTRVAASREINNEDRNALHKRLVEDVLCGLDINQHAVQLAACNMTLGAPTVDYDHMNLVTMPHGPQSDGTPKAGSLEILTAADGDRDLQTVRAAQRSLEALDGSHVNESEEIRFPPRNLDMVIMNAPFTANENRSKKYGDEGRKSMQDHELAIRETVEARDCSTAGVITPSSISTFFTPLAEKLLHHERGTLAKVLPAAACTSGAGVAERRFLAKRFHVERIVTTHDPRRIAFSENTSIHECLLICRRHLRDDHPPTEFVSLRRMPESVEEAVEAAEAIAAGHGRDWGRSCTWPSERIRAGDWTPVQWYDGELAEIVRVLETQRDLVPAGSVLKTGASRQAAQDSWKRATDVEHPQQVWVFDSISAKTRHSMLGSPEQRVVPGGRRAHLHEKVLASKGSLMLAERFNTVSGVLTALWSETATFGFGWLPAKAQDEKYEQALCAWWNSTPGRLLLLNRRGKTLTYPKWSVEHVTSLPCPKAARPGCKELAKAWQQTCRTPLLPMRQAEECPVRRAIDEAAAIALGVDDETLADWRRRLAAEPTITNAHAPAPARTAE